MSMVPYTKFIEMLVIDGATAGLLQVHVVARLQHCLSRRQTFHSAE